MFKLTFITLEDGVCALYINGQYLGADDCSDERFSLGDILERLSRLPGVSVETATRPVPQNADWSWDEVAGSVFESGSPARKMTVAAFKQRLAGYPEDALCCGTFWLADDFLALDASLDDDAIDAAMERAEDSHDANIGFNWEYLQSVIEAVKE